jgi:hypothetical protein
MEEKAAPTTKSQWDIGALTHAFAGVSAIVLGGLMYSRAWAQDLFSALMVMAAASAIYFSWRHNAWVRGHWLAMVPVMGVILGYGGWPIGFTLAYGALWLAFIHFVVRGLQSLRSTDAAKDGE